MNNINNTLTIDLDKIIANRNKSLARYTPKFAINYLKKIIHQDEINQLLLKNKDSYGIEFATNCLNDLNVKCNIKYLDKDGLDLSKRYIFVSNHPLGGLDGLLLIKELGGIFGNIKFVVNDLLMNIKPLEPIFVPVNKHGRMTKDYGKLINDAYSSSTQILYFPAGLCSRKINGNITDTEWQKNYLRQAIKYERDIVPIFFKGTNSNFFYALARIRKLLKIKFNIEMLFLPNEMFLKKNHTFDLFVGKPISNKELANSRDLPAWNCKIREIVYNLEEQFKKQE